MLLTKKKVFPEVMFSSLIIFLLAIILFENSGRHRTRLTSLRVTCSIYQTSSTLRILKIPSQTVFVKDLTNYSPSSLLWPSNLFQGICAPNSELCWKTLMLEPLDKILGMKLGDARGWFRTGKVQGRNQIKYLEDQTCWFYSLSSPPPPRDCMHVSTSLMGFALITG